MEIEISDKYNDLFAILEAKEKLEILPKNHPDYNYYYKLSLIDTVIMSGGRDSGKSYSSGIFVSIAVKDYNHRVLYTRYTMNSTDHSISEALTERMIDLNVTDKFEFASNTYTCKDNNGKIFITGQKTSSLNQTAKLKSLENFSIFITDEAEEIKTFEEWDKIRKSIRAKDVQCLNILIFNPPTYNHWLYTEFYEEMGIQEGFNGIQDNIMYIHTTFEDNIDHIAEHNLREYLKLQGAYNEYESLPDKEIAPKKLIKDWKKYRHVVLGHFMSNVDGVIYDDWEIGEFNDNLPYCYGLDFGSNDPDAIVKVAVDRDNLIIYLDEIHFKNNTGTAQLMQIIHSKIGTNDLIIADSAQRRLIKDFYHGMYGDDGKYYSGVNIRKVRKSKGNKLNFVARRIKTIQSYKLVVTKGSINLQKALHNYRWHDNKSGIPNHDWSDLCDAFGYAAIDLIEY